MTARQVVHQALMAQHSRATAGRPQAGRGSLSQALSQAKGRRTTSVNCAFMSGGGREGREELKAV